MWLVSDRNHLTSPSLNVLQLQRIEEWCRRSTHSYHWRLFQGSDKLLSLVAVPRIRYSGGAQIPGLISPWRLNVVRWRLIFVDSGYWTSSCHRSCAWKFEVGSRFLENVFTAALQSCSGPNMNPSDRNLTTTVHLVGSHFTDRNIICLM